MYSIFVIGFVCGMYAASQIENHIDENIKNETYPEFKKKHYKK